MCATVSRFFTTISERHRTWQRRVSSLLACGLFGATLTTSARANNDPALERWTLETKHFHITYDTALEPVAVRLARLAESIHDRLGTSLGHRTADVTEILLTDFSDSANGSAIAVPYNQIQLFVTAPSDLSPLADYDDWYLGLLTHEYTHILHTDTISGVPAVLNAIFGKRLAPNQAQPRWLLEGLAVLQESDHTTAGRVRSSLFDAYLRADVLEGKLAGLDAVSNNPQRWPQGNLWYLYGSRFLHWISELYGRDVLRSIVTDYGATLVPLGINRAIRRQTGRTYEELYEGWKEYLERTYGEQLRAIERRGRREGRRITFSGRTVSYPAFMPKAARGNDAKGYKLAYFRNDLNTRGGIYAVELTAGGDAARATPELIARSTSESSFSFAPNGDLFFSSVVPFRNVYSWSDLFRLPANTRATDGREAWRTTLTNGLRAAAPSVSPDGQHVVFTENGKGTTTLRIAELRPDGELAGARTLAQANDPFDQVYTPCYSPDGLKVAFSRWTKGGFRDIVILELATKKVVAVTHDRALDTNPTWSPDGTRLYFASDRSGVFNIYEYGLATQELWQVTNVATLATMPAISPDGRELAYVGYTAAGFDLYAMPLAPSRYLSPPKVPALRPEPLDEPASVPFTKRKYQPLETLRPRAYGFDFGQGSFGASALALSVNGADIAGHHGFGLRLLADFGAPSPQASVAYEYTRMPFDVGVQASNRVAPRTGAPNGGMVSTYTENSYNLGSSLSYRRPGEFAAQSFGLSYTASLVSAATPFEALPSDPLSDATKPPKPSFLGTVHLGYGVGRVEGSIDTPGPARGFAVSVGLNVSDAATGSSESLYEGNYSAVGYLPLPWGKNHVLALRSAGGMSTGSFSRRGVYFVGGYNLTDNTVLDTVTAGTYNGAFVLRGYPASSYHGSTYTLQTAELRFPLAVPDRGLSSLPLYLRRIDGNLYIDYGGAFDAFDSQAVRFFSKGTLIDSPQLHTGIGGELWFGSTIGYVLDVNMRLGYAFGFSQERFPGGQLYCLAASAF